MRTPDFKARAVIENTDTPWPYIGNGFKNADGSISLLLDRGVKVVLADGTLLEAAEQKLVKIYIATSKPEAQAEPAEPDKPAKRSKKTKAA